MLAEVERGHHFGATFIGRGVAELPEMARREEAVDRQAVAVELDRCRRGVQLYGRPTGGVREAA